MAAASLLAFGALLKRYRRAARMTQAELAERAGFSVTYISKLECGARVPQRATVALLADALSLTPAERATLETALRLPPDRRLLDLHRPERLFRLVLPDLPGDFPPLNALDQRAHNLPVQPTPLLGREQEMRQLAALLRREDVRLVTLSGVGGVGKTRLALQVAAELSDAFADGVRYVRLSQLVDPTLVLPTIVQTLGVREIGRRPIEELLREHLRTRRLLLLLDNCEQVAAAAPQVADLLASSPGLKVLVTSRVALHLRGEHQVQVLPLALPALAQLPAPDALVRYAAVALFIERAQAAKADFQMTNATAPAVAEICARLDGVPLAIELAAARVKLLPPPALLKRLERALPMLTGGARDVDERQRTMRAALSWSEHLLSSEERRLFRRLAVFVGSFTLAAAEAVCATPDGAEPLGVEVVDGLGALMDQSLVQRWSVGQDGADEEEGSGEVRFRLLYIIREYALEYLEGSASGSGSQAGQEAEALHRAHAAYLLALAERAEPELQGPAQVAWLDRLEHEHDNFRAALAWAQAHPRTEGERGLRLAAALEPFWWARGHLREGRAWTEGLLAVVAPPQSGGAGTDGEVSMVVWARALQAAVWLAIFTGEDYGPTAARLEAAMAVARAAGDLRTTAECLNVLDAAAYFEGDLARSATQLEECVALFRAAGSMGDVALTLGYLCEVALHQGDVARATAVSEEALTLARRTGQLQAEVVPLCILGQLALRRGDLPTALALHRQGLALSRELADPRRIATTLEYLAHVVVAAGHGEQAARLLGTATALREAIGAPQPSVERTLNEQEVLTARQALGEEAWAAAFAAGRALTLEEAISEALGEDADAGNSAAEVTQPAPEAPH
jgi:predicted ATPase/transcriptional regulator with XRE-family HTH domain